MLCVSACVWVMHACVYMYICYYLLAFLSPFRLCIVLVWCFLSDHGINLLDSYFIHPEHRHLAMWPKHYGVPLES